MALPYPISQCPPAADAAEPSHVILEEQLQESPTESRRRSSVRGSEGDFGVYGAIDNV